MADDPLASNPDAYSVIFEELKEPALGGPGDRATAAPLGPQT